MRERRPGLARAGALIAAAGLSAAILLSGLGARLERDLGLGLLYAIRGPVDIPDEAVIVTIDRRSVDWLRFHSPDLERTAPELAACLGPDATRRLARAFAAPDLPRVVYACLIDGLAAAGARPIVLDILFARETAEDARLEAAIADAREVLLFERIEAADRTSLAIRHSPRARFAAASAGTGMFLLEAPSGGYLEGYVTRLDAFPELAPLSSRAFEAATGRTAGPDPGPLTRPLWLYAPPGGLPSLSLSAALAEPAARAMVARRTAFVGLSEPETPGVPDHFRVPIPGADGRAMAGVEIMATAFLNRLRDERLSRPRRGARGALAAALGALMAAAALALPGLPGLFAIGLGTALYVAGAGALFAWARLWLPVATPLFVLAPVAMLAALALRYASARRLIGELAPVAIASGWLDRGETHGGRGALKSEPATVLLADVVGSSRFASRLSADSFTALMQRFYDLAAGPIDAHGGLIVEFPGDSTLAVFTETHAGTAHAARALAAAEALCREIDGAGLLPGLGPADRLRLRIALHSGPTVTGTVGATHRYSFRALGDSVNLTFALERFGKTVRTSDAHLVLLTGAAIGESGLDPARTVFLGARLLPARSAPTPIYRLRPI